MESQPLMVSEVGVRPQASTSAPYVWSVITFVMALIGFIIEITVAVQNSDTLIPLATTTYFVTKRSLEFAACFLVFTWLCSAIGAHFERPHFLFISCGLICAVFTFVAPLSEMNQLRSHHSYENNSKLLAGFILSYLAICVRFLAALRHHEQMQTFPFVDFIPAQKFFAFLTFVAIIAGSIAVSYSDLLLVLFPYMEGIISVSFVYFAGIWYRAEYVMNIAIAINAFMNLQSLGFLLSLLDLHAFAKNSDPGIPGVVLCWLAGVFMMGSYFVKLAVPNMLTPVAQVLYGEGRV